MRRAALILTLFGLVAASCGGSSSERDYDVANRNAFLENCQYEGGDPSSCAASLECIEERLTQEEFEYEENWLILRGEFSDRMTDVLATCMSRMAVSANAVTDEDQTSRTNPPQGWPDKITFGFVPSQEQEQLQDDIQPFMDVLEAALGIEVEGFVTTDYTGLVTAMGTGKADLGAFGPFGYTLAQDQFGNIEPLILAVRYGAATYHGQWFTNDASICDSAPVSGTALENSADGIVQVSALDAVALQVGVYFGDSGKALGESVDAGDVSAGMSCQADLSKVAGKTVAFTSESSTSGSLFPRLQLINAGIDPDNDISAIYTGSHDAAVVAVYNGDADIGLAYDDARRSIRKTNPDVGDKVIVFNLTGEIPNDIVAASTLLPSSLRTAIYDAVANYLATEEGEAVFDSIYGWTDIAKVDDSEFDIVRDAADKLGITERPG